jgi:serine/threonine protein kinase
MPKAGDVIAGKYRIDSLIGEGGMGAVFSAIHVHTGRRLAVKWLLPDVARSDAAIQRLFREAQATGRIDHPNVVDVYDVGEQDGSAFLVMELLTGETLTKALERGALKVPDIIRMVLAAVDGTAAAHRQGVVHRDIKPDNIFLCRDASGTLQTAKVLDFGISKISSIGGQVNPRLTKTGAVMGTPYYMSPEQIRGSAEIDGRVDIYGFGVILYEALTGRVPFDGKTYSALVLEIATGTPARPSQVNPNLVGSLERVILKAMSREPEDRYPSMEALAKALAPFAAGVEGQGSESIRIEIGRTSGPSTTPFVSDSPPTVPVQRGPLLVALAAGLLALTIGLSIWLMQGNDEPEHIAAPAVPSGEPHAAAAAVASPPKAEPKPEPLAPEPLAPDAGAAVAAPAPPDTAQTAPRDRRREPQPAEGPAPTENKGSGRSGTITTDDF